MKTKGLGEFEELILLAVCILDGNAYGISVKKEIERHTKQVMDWNLQRTGAGESR